MYKDKKIVAFIPARSGSKRLPNKNSKELCGKPLIAWSIECAMNVQIIDEIVVTTDDFAVKEICKKYPKIKVVDRPSELATDLATTEDVLVHAINTLDKEPYYGVLLQPTSPLRSSKEVEGAIIALHDSKKSVAVSFTPTPKPANFYFVEDEAGNIERIDSKSSLYLITGSIYVFNTKDFMATKKLVQNDTLIYKCSDVSSVDIDTISDFNYAEAVLRNGYAPK